MGNVGSDLSWNSGNAAELAQAQEASFALHEANGTLDLRLKALGRYADDEAMQALIARHPAYLDFFLRLQEPEDFAAAFDDFSRDQTRREALLEALLLNPGPEGQRQFEHVVIRWGSALEPFADLPEFGTLIEQMVWVGREGGTPDFEDWLYDLLDDADPNEIEPLTLMLASHGGLLRHEIDIAGRWKVLEAAIQRNPELRDLLLGHLDLTNVRKNWG